MSDKLTAPKILAMKAAGQKIVCVTAYDVPMARLADAAGVDLILVGDSVGNTVLGYETTLPVSLADMIHHTSAVARTKPRALLVADMPFGSYQSSIPQAVDSAVALMKAGAEAVKLEGAYAAQIEAICAAGIPVMGHVGMTPQSVNAFGGFKVQGRGDSGERVLEDTQLVEQAGAFSVVLELIPASLSEKITQSVNIPTIGIGAGIGCDGQIQVLYDVLGFGSHSLKHAKRYAEVGQAIERALKQYGDDVRSSAFPCAENSF